MSRPAITAGGPLRWCRQSAVGLYRSAVLIGLTVAIPVVCAPVAYFGTEFALSWSARSHFVLALQIVVTVGEVAMGAFWTFIVAALAVSAGSRPLSQAARALADRWLGLRLEVDYAPPPPVTQMSTGFWWNGYEYHRTEKDARSQARMEQHSPRDPQYRRDVRWIAVSALTVLPAAALPLLAIAFGVDLALQPGRWAWGAALIAAGLIAAPVAWRVFGPVAAAFLGQPAPSKVEELTAIQADMTQTQAAELERIERSLHDGAQARILSLGLAMGAAEHLLDTDPEAARPILAEARASAAAALAELRDLARGINPPVLAERGLADAVRALALDAPVQVSVRSDLPSRPERPVEAALYFAVSELLANVAKHARATRATIDLGYDGATLTATVTDDGEGGASAEKGSGLSGINRRISAFGGRLEIDSPVDGPTRITVAVPCALS
jgi:signal transduction histidine kinase